MKLADLSQACVWSLCVMSPVFASAGIPSAPVPRSLEQEPRARVPIVFARNQVRVPVSIGGSEPFQLLLDTGMPTPGLLLQPSARVDALGLAFEDEDTLTGAGGSGGAVVSRVAHAARVDVGSVALAHVPVIVLPSAAKLPPDVDGVIGAELFEHFAVRIDVDARRMELFDAKTYTPPKESSVVPLRVTEVCAFVTARVAVGAGEPLEVELGLDLGAGHGLWLNERDDGSLAPPASAITTRLGHGLSGALQGKVGRTRRVELGGFTFENVLALFPVSEHRHPGDYDFRDGFVGAEILTRFHVTFDYAGKRLVLERGGRYAEPFEHDMTGLVLSPQGKERRVVDAVLPGSPAEQAGIVAGDVLVAIDGEPLAAAGADGIARAFRKGEGVEVRVKIERGFERVEKTLRLRRLV